jgi:hypothetical protein
LGEPWPDFFGGRRSVGLCLRVDDGEETEGDGSECDDGKMGYADRLTSQEHRGKCFVVVLNYKRTCFYVNGASELRTAMPKKFLDNRYMIQDGKLWCLEQLSSEDVIRLYG